MYFDSSPNFRYPTQVWAMKKEDVYYFFGLALDNYNGSFYCSVSFSLFTELKTRICMSVSQRSPHVTGSHWASFSRRSNGRTCVWIYDTEALRRCIHHLFLFCLGKEECDAIWRGWRLEICLLCLLQDGSSIAVVVEYLASQGFFDTDGFVIISRVVCRCSYRSQVRARWFNLPANLPSPTSKHLPCQLLHAWSANLRGGDDTQTSPPLLLGRFWRLS